MTSAYLLVEAAPEARHLHPDASGAARKRRLTEVLPALFGRRQGAQSMSSLNPVIVVIACLHLLFAVHMISNCDMICADACI